MRIWLAILFLLLSALGAQGVAPPEVGIAQRLDASIPLELAFQDQDGKRVTLEGYFGERPVLIAMVYYGCPNLCEHVLNGLVKSLTAQRFDVGKALTVLAVSIDPGEGPAEAEARRQLSMKRYGRAGSEGGWHFLTGEEASIRSLAEALGIRYAYDPATKQYAHPAGMAIATPKGRIARYLFGIAPAPRDLGFAVQEAAENRIGSPVEQILLRCFHYDPQQGRYSLAIMEVLKLGGVATLLGLGALVGGLFAADRRRRRKGGTS